MDYRLFGACFSVLGQKNGVIAPLIYEEDMDFYKTDESIIHKNVIPIQKVCESIIILIIS